MTPGLKMLKQLNTLKNSPLGEKDMSEYSDLEILNVADPGQKGNAKDSYQAADLSMKNNSLYTLYRQNGRKISIDKGCKTPGGIGILKRSSSSMIGILDQNLLFSESRINVKNLSNT